MKLEALTEEENNAVELLTGELSANSFVECVFVLPYSLKDSDESVVWVGVIPNNGALNPTPEEKEKEEAEWKALVDRKDKFNAENKDNRMECTLEQNGDYIPAMMHNREILAMTNLVSGAIVFDRNGRYTKYKERFSSELKPYNNVLTTPPVQL